MMCSFVMLSAPGDLRFFKSFKQVRSSQSSTGQWTIPSSRGVSHYRILPVSRDICWPVQQLDYFRYIIIHQHIMTVDHTL